MTEKEILMDELEWLMVAVADHYLYAKEHPIEEQVGFRYKSGKLTEDDAALLERARKRLETILDNCLFIGEKEMQKFKKEKKEEFEKEFNKKCEDDQIELLKEIIRKSP